MKLKIIPLIGVLFWAFSIRSMAQTTITYAYDSAGNRTGRVVTTLLTANGAEDYSSEGGSFSVAFVKMLMNSTEFVLLLNTEDSHRPTIGHVLWAVTPAFSRRECSLVLTDSPNDIFREQKRPLAHTDGAENLPGVQIGRALFTEDAP